MTDETDPETTDDEQITSITRAIKEAGAKSRRGGVAKLPEGGLVEEVLAMFAHSGPTRDPLLEKITPAQINRVIEVRLKKEENAHLLRIERQKSADRLTTKLLVFLSLVIVAILALCWLFLHYGKTEQVFNLLAMLFAGGGGVGIGLGLRKPRTTDIGDTPADRD